MLTEDWHPFRRHLAIGTDGTLTRTGEVEIFDSETGVPVETRHMSLPGEPRGTGAFMGPVAIVEFATVEFEARSTEVYGQSGDLSPIKLDSPEGMVTEGVRRVVDAGVGDTGVATLLDAADSETRAAALRVINESGDELVKGDGIELEQDPVTSGTIVRVADRLKQAFLDLRFVLASGRSVDGTNAPGVDATGVVECSAAIQAVLDAHAKTGDAFARMVRLQGTFNIANTLVVKGHVDFSAAIFRYSGSGTAIRVGDASVGQFRRPLLSFSEIICTSKPATAGSWLAGTVGLELRNVSTSPHIRFNRIFNFAEGLKLVGDSTYGAGHTAYNTIALGHLDNNLVNESLQCIGGGAAYPFVNENKHIGGTMSHSEGTAPVAGMRHVLIGSDADDYGINGNSWNQTSLEGGREQWTIECHGNENLWDFCRYEFVPPGGSATGAPVLFGPKAARNVLRGGYTVDIVVITDSAPVAGDPLRASGSLSNQVIGNRSWQFETVGNIGLGLSAGGGTSFPVLSVLPNAWRRLALDPATKYIVRLLGNGALQMKLKDDVAPRIELDPVTRTIELGGGFDTTSVRVIGADYHGGGVTASGPLQGSLRFNYHPSNPFGLFMKTPLSASSWQNLGFPPVTTATRPAPANAGAGGAVFNTTTGRPEWSTGTSWVDATGTVV